MNHSISLLFLRFRRLGKENMLPVPMSLLLVRMNSQFCSPHTVHSSDRMKGFHPPFSSKSDSVGGGNGGEEQRCGQDEVVGLGGGECGEAARLEGVRRLP